MGAFVRRYRLPAAAYVVVGLVLAAIGHVAQQVRAGDDPLRGELFPVERFLAGWIQFDGWEYLRIATDGYWYAPDARAPVVFFPLYPLAIRGVGRATGWDAAPSAMAVTALAGLAVALLFWRWLTDRGLSPAARTTALLVLLLYPYGWFLYGVVYADALFVALVLGAFLLGSRRHWVLAGLVGALATATRPTGLALVPGLLVLALTQGGVLTVPSDARGLVARWQLPVRFDRSALRAWMAGPLLAIGGVAAYATYLGVRFGDPWIFATDQSQYQGSGIKTLLKAGLVYDLIHWEDPVYTLTAAAQAAIVVAMAVAVPFVGRRHGWGYGIYVAALVAIPTLISRDYVGTGRYLLAAFPVAALVGELLAERPRLRVAWLATSALLLATMAYGFAQSEMLS